MIACRLTGEKDPGESMAESVAALLVALAKNRRR